MSAHGMEEHIIQAQSLRQIIWLKKKIQAYLHLTQKTPQ